MDAGRSLLEDSALLRDALTSPALGFQHVEMPAPSLGFQHVEMPAPALGFQHVEMPAPPLDHSRRKNIRRGRQRKTAGEPSDPLANSFVSDKCDAETYRADRARFKKRTALEAYKWMTLNDCRLPATKIRSLDTYDFDLSEYPGINRILERDSLGLSTTNMGVMFYSIVRPTPDIIKMFQCDNKVDVLAKVADAYNRILHTQNISAQSFIKMEWAAHSEFAIFVRQHRLPPSFCRTDRLWLRRVFPETVQPTPDDVPMPHVQKAQTYKLRRDVAVYVIGCGDMSQISDMSPRRFEDTGRNMYKMFYDVMAGVPSYVLSNCGWIFNENRGTRKRTIDSSRVYLERIAHYEKLDDNHQAFASAVEQFMLMWLNAESYARDLRTNSNESTGTARFTEPRLNRMRGVVLHNVRFREENRYTFKVFYFRNAENYVTSTSCIDPFLNETAATEDLVEEYEKPVYFYETLSAASKYPQDCRTVCPAHLATNVRTEKTAVTEMLSNSRHTVNYQHKPTEISSVSGLPYDPYYPGVVVSERDKMIERIFLNKIENGGNLNSEETRLIMHYDRGRLREDYTSEDEEGAVRSRATASGSEVFTSVSATWSDPSTSKPVNINIPVENVMTTKHHDDMVNSEVNVIVDERNFVSTVYFNEPGMERGMRKDKYPPKHLSYPDHVIRVSKVMYERDNVFRLLPEHYMVFRNMPCMLYGSASLKEVVDSECLCEEHQTGDEGFLCEEAGFIVPDTDEYLDYDPDELVQRMYVSGEGTLTLAESNPRVDVTPAESIPRVDVAPAESNPRVDVTPAESIPQVDVTPAERNPRVDVAPAESNPRVDMTPEIVSQDALQQQQRQQKTTDSEVDIFEFKEELNFDMLLDM